MPLVRYEIRNEHSLANPQLYRTAAKDDPEGLLEGVAMAGLVGIVRQLGDLAEFAAEVFRDLHEEVMATASRGHDLLARVQQLEAEMPAVEKALLSETNQLRFAYTPGVEWHASIRNDQNHCTQGDLPRFIRSSYEECRGPPRLFLLDKFDVAGAGACLKRYTDPSFFRTEWASSELMKAERVHRDKKARREKKKGRRRRNVDGKESILAEQYQSTFSQELSRELSQRNQAHPRMGHQPHSEVSKNASSVVEDTNYNENLNALSRHLAESQSHRQHVRTSNISTGSTAETLDNSMDVTVPTVSKVLTSSPPKYQNSVTAISVDEEMEREWDETGPEASHKDEIEAQEEAVVTTVGDGGSEAEQFLDASTTMGSKADCDSDPHLRQDRDAGVDADKVQDSTESQPITSHEDLKVPGIQISADEKITLLEEQSETSISLDPSRQEISQEPRPIINGRDLRSTSSSTTAMHSRRQSPDSISSVSSRKAKHVQLFEEPHENFRSGSEPFRILKDEKGVTESFNQGPVLPFNSGVKVSKMVAAIERGSLEQVHAEEIEEERQGVATVLQTVVSDSDAVNQPTVEIDNVGVPEDHTSESNSPSQFCMSPAEVDSTSSQDGFPKSYVSPPRGIEGRRTSVSSYTSLGSQDSPPDFPTFSTLPSPVSPIRTERNILLSPDRLGFPTETPSPGSPTSVPILALSPTTQGKKHPEFLSLERGHAQVAGEPFSLTPPSSSPADFPSTPQSKNTSEESSQSLTTNTIMDDSAATLLSSEEDSSRLLSALPTRSLDDPLVSIPPVIPPAFVSPVQNSSDSSEELHDSSPTVHDVVHTSRDKPELNTLPRTEVVGYSHDPTLSTSESIDDDVSISPSLNNNGADDASSEVEGRVPQKPTFLATPSVSLYDGTPLTVSKSNQDPSPQSPMHHDVAPPISSSGKPDKFTRTSTRSFETASQFSRDDFLFIPKAAHRRFPSLPLVEKTAQDFSHAASSNSSRSPPAALIPSKATSGAQLSGKFALKAPSPSPMSRIVHDFPYPVRKAAHNRFPSFPSSDGSMLEVPTTSPQSIQLASTSAMPSRHPPDAQVLASKFQHDQPSPSQTLGILPPPTPPSKSEQDFPPAPPPPSQALHELPPPLPPPGSSPPLPATKPSASVDVQDGLLEAIASHDKSTLKKVKTMQNPSLRKGDERSHLLEQIRAQSFNLRHTVVEKVDPPLPRPVTNINVAAILEKANAIRQAFAGSDEDDEDNDDWSDV